MDFTNDDGAIWPIQMSPGGALYSFCPGKATWDHMAREVYGILVMSMEMGCLYNAGGIINQPTWYLDLMSFFGPIYDKLKFTSKARMVLGDGKSTKTPPSLNRRH